MNVIIGNKYRDLLANLQIDVIKSLQGEYEVDELLSHFTNFFFGKMVLDITSVKNFTDIKNIQKISLNLDVDKIIFFLDPENAMVNSPQYLSQLISMGIYNFTTTLDGINYLLQNPNQYKDVANMQQISGVGDTTVNMVSNNSGIRVIGVKNLTDHAGATTLIYMMKKELSKSMPTLAVELDKKDFMYFNDKDMISVRKEDLSSTLLRYKNYQVILVDLNESGEEQSCNDVIYLVEPSIVRLNKLMRKDFKVFERLRGKKIVVNNTILSKNDLSNFEAEARIKIFFNIPPQNERNKDLPVIIGLLTKLGLIRGEQPKSKGLFKF